MSTLVTRLMENPGLKLVVWRDGRLLGTFGIDEFLAAVEGGHLRGTDDVAAEHVIERATVGEIHPAVMVAASRPRPGWVAQSLPRRRRGVRAELGAIVPAAGIGCLGAGGGGAAGIVGLIVLGLYIWGTIDMNRGGALEQQTAALRDKIVRHVDAHPEFTATSADALMKVSGLLDADDRELIADEQLVLHAVDARSPPESLVIVRPKRGGQRMYYKNGHNDYIVNLASPDGRHTIVNEPQEPLGSGRLVRLLDQSGREVLVHRTPGFSVSAQWRPDGQMAFLNETSKASVRLTIVQVRPDAGARFIPGGSELEPAAMLPPELQYASLRWLSDNVSAQRWLENGALRVERYFNVTVLDGQDQPRAYVTARQQLDVAIGDDGSLRVVGHEPVQYHHSTPTAAAPAVEAVN